MADIVGEYSESIPIIGNIRSGCLQQYSNEEQCTSTNGHAVVLESHHSGLDRVNQHSSQGKGENSSYSGDDSCSGDREATRNCSNFLAVPRRKKVTLVLCVSAMLLSQAAVSVLGPFYPLEAQGKGMGMTMIGFVFGVFQLIVFASSPIIGSFMTRIGVKFVFLSGIFIGGCCSVLFGLLDKVPGGAAFISMSLLVRSVGALGFSGFMTASMTIVTSEFPDHIGTSMALLKAGAGLGHMIGPVVAGLLYELGGYGLPFYTIGALSLLNGIVVYGFLHKDQNNSKTQRNKSSLWNLFRSSLIVFSMLVAYFTVAGIAMAITTLAKHLTPFDISQAAVGGMFAIGASVVFVMAPVWGYLTDVKDQQAGLTIFGHVVACVSWLILGPSDILPVASNGLWSIGIGLFLIGLSFGCLIVTSMKCMMTGAFELNYESNEDTCALVSGLHNSASALGGFTGPVIAGALVDRFGFPVGYSLIALVNMVMVFLSLGYFSFRYYLKSRKSMDDEYLVLHNQSK